MMRTIADAVLLYILRDTRILDPDGGFDKHGRWWADENTEERPCCKRHYPSRRRQYRQIKHCRTLQHICTLYNVDYDEARKELRKPHWRALRELVRLGGRTGMHRCARPTIQEHAARLVDLLIQHANQFTEDELTKTARWLSQYDPRAETVDWNSTRVVAALRRDNR